MEMQNSLMPWVIFKVQNGFYSLSSENVIAIIKQPEMTKLPQMHHTIKGIARYREEIYKTYDLRRIIGIKTKEDELVEFEKMMDLRKQDHVNWLKTLEKCVDESIPFTLEKDPHKCAFGRWYDSFDTSDLKLRSILNKFDRPHKKIHSIAHEVSHLHEKKEYEKSKEVIHRTKANELMEMMELFDEVKKAYRRVTNEYLILLKNEKEKCAIAVDSVLSIETILDIEGSERTDDMLETLSGSMKFTVGKTNSGDFVFRLADTNFLNIQTPKFNQD